LVKTKLEQPDQLCQPCMTIATDYSEQVWNRHKISRYRTDFNAGTIVRRMVTAAIDQIQVGMEEVTEGGGLKGEGP